MKHQFIHIALAMLLANASTAEVWHTYHGNYALTGVSESSFPDKPDRVWRTKVGEDLPSAIVGGHGRLFCIADDTNITALGISGERLWTRTFKADKLSPDGEQRGERFSAPLLYVNDGLLIAAANSGRVLALAPATGETIWETKIEGRIRGTPNYTGRGKDGPGWILVVSTERGIVHALSGADGTTLWKSEELDRTDGHAAADEEYVVLGNCTASFLTLFASDGKTAGSIEVGKESEMAGGVALYDGQVFGGNRRGSVVAANIDKCSIMWRHEKGQGELFTTPAVNDRNVIFYGTDGAIYCVKRKTGKELWSRELEGNDPVSPIIADDTVVAGVDGTLHAMNIKDGKSAWSIEIGDEVTVPAVIDGKLVVGVDDGYVAAYGKDGK